MIKSIVFSSGLARKDSCSIHVLGPLERCDCATNDKNIPVWLAIVITEVFNSVYGLFNKGWRWERRCLYN